VTHAKTEPHEAGSRPLNVGTAERRRTFAELEEPPAPTSGKGSRMGKTGECKSRYDTHFRGLRLLDVEGTPNVSESGVDE
jgi:hypothetical protein